MGNESWATCNGRRIRHTEISKIPRLDIQDLLYWILIYHLAEIPAISLQRILFSPLLRWNSDHELRILEYVRAIWLIPE